ncbi:MAG: hypothetical protein AAF433_01565 [Bacteroidota bacterium]
MLTEFSSLSPEEQELLKNAPALITILVGGADDDLSEEELGKALKTVRIRAYNEEYELQFFYQRLEAEYDDQVAAIAQLLPPEPEERLEILSQRLAKVNAVLAKLSTETAYAFYQDLRTFATTVARAEGGFLRWITIGPKEAKVVDLPMIEPIAEPE